VKERNEDDEEEVVEDDEENPDPFKHLEQDLYPQSIINIRATEQFLIDRC